MTDLTWRQQAEAEFNRALGEVQSAGVRVSDAGALHAALHAALDVAERPIRADERERVRQGHEQAMKRLERTIARVQEKAVSRAVAAERKRIVSLLRDEASKLAQVREVSAQVAAGTFTDAADMIEGGADG